MFQKDLGLWQNKFRRKKNVLWAWILISQCIHGWKNGNIWRNSELYCKSSEAIKTGQGWEYFMWYSTGIIIPYEVIWQLNIPKTCWYVSWCEIIPVTEVRNIQRVYHQCSNDYRAVLLGEGKNCGWRELPGYLESHKS